jgi:hypothetical protein
MSEPSFTVAHSLLNAEGFCISCRTARAAASACAVGVGRRSRVRAAPSGWRRLTTDSGCTQREAKYIARVARHVFYRPLQGMVMMLMRAARFLLHAAFRIVHIVIHAARRAFRSVQQRFVATSFCCMFHAAQ